MRTVFRLLAVVLDAVLEVSNSKPKTESMNMYEAQEKLDLGLICIDEYNDAIRDNHKF